MISTPKEINHFATGQQNRLGHAANSQSQLGGEQERLPRIATTLLLAAVGLIQAFAGRNMMNPDGIQYIEVALNYAQRNWSSAVNAYWSPLYSWALGLVLQSLAFVMVIIAAALTPAPLRAASGSASAA